MGGGALERVAAQGCAAVAEAAGDEDVAGDEVGRVGVGADADDRRTPAALGGHGPIINSVVSPGDVPPRFPVVQIAVL